MILKTVAGLIAVALVLIYLAPPVYKLREVELGVVVAIGVILMLVDLWQSLHKDD